jgi:hypothetical protein
VTDRAEDVRDCMPLFHSGRGGSSPTSALQLTVRECSAQWAQSLNALWHSVLPNTHVPNILGNIKSVSFWADYNDRAFAVAIWTTPIAANRMTDGWSALELRRFAIAPDAPKNTASRTLAVMRRLISAKWPDVKRLISYQAESFHAGTIYRAAGWSPVSRSEPTIWTHKRRVPALHLDSAKIRWEMAL